MELLEIIKKRYSVREYKPDLIHPKQIGEILEAARLAPTAANRQPFRIIVVHTKNREEELRRIYPRDWFVRAPILLCVCGIPSEAWVRADGKSYLDVDAAIVMDHITLVATNLGLGTCWVAAFDPKAAREILRIPPDVEPIIFSPLGYPQDQPGPKERKSIEEIVRYEYW
jgi:nitroreductase